MAFIEEVRMSARSAEKVKFSVILNVHIKILLINEKNEFLQNDFYNLIIHPIIKTNKECVAICKNEKEFLKILKKRTDFAENELNLFKYLNRNLTPSNPFCFGDTLFEKILKNAKEIKKVNELKKAEELKKLEEIKKAEELKKLEEIKKVNELKKLEEIKKAEELKKLEEIKKVNELKRLEEIKKVNELKRLEEIKRAEELKRLEEIKRAEELKKTRRPRRKETKKRKTYISSQIKKKIWDLYIGEDKGKSKCFCCKVGKISQLTFQCGFIICEKNGGTTHSSNLLPICKWCDSRTRDKDLYDLKKTL